MSNKNEEMTLQKLQAIENEIKGSKKKAQNEKKPTPNNKNANAKGNKKNVNPIMDTPIKANQIISDEELEELKRKKKKNNKKAKTKINSEAKIEELIENKKANTNKTKNKDTEKPEEKVEIETEKLDKISKELRLIKLENEKKRYPKVLKIFVNIILAIAFILYIYLIMMVPQTVEKNTFILGLKITALVLAGISVILLEIGFSKKKSGLYFHSLEFLFLAGYTLSLTLLIIKESYLTKAFQIASISILVHYFLIKSIVIMVREQK